MKNLILPNHSNVSLILKRRTLAHGTTTANYYATIHKESSCLLADLVKKHGQRAFIGKVNMNKNTPPDYGETEESSIQDTKDFIEYVLNLKSSLIKPVITPRFALSCDMNLMKGLGMLAAEYDLPIQTHVSENLEEIKQVKMDFPEIKNYVGVYETAGLVTYKVIEFRVMLQTMKKFCSLYSMEPSNNYFSIPLLPSPPMTSSYFVLCRFF